MHTSLLNEFCCFLIYRATLPAVAAQAALDFTALASKWPLTQLPVRGATLTELSVRNAATFPRAEPVPMAVLQRVHKAIERAAVRQRYRSAEEFAESRGARGRFGPFRTAAYGGAEPVTVARLADLIVSLDLTLADLAADHPFPWTDWPPRLPVTVCIGARQATTHGTGRAYRMLQQDDAWSGMELVAFFRRAGISDRVELFTPTTPDAAKGRLDRVRATGGALIVVGSEHANPAYSPATARMREGKAADDGYDLALTHHPYQLTHASLPGSPWSLVGDADAGLVRVWRGEAKNKHPLVIATVAGLGPAGTLAAALALTCPHEVASRTIAPDYAAGGVVVPKAGALLGTHDIEGLERDTAAGIDRVENEELIEEEVIEVVRPWMWCDEV